MNLKGIGMRYFVAAPDIISFLNLVFGFLAIIMVFEQNLYLAGCFVIIAVIFDSIDGWVARKTGRDDVFGFGMNIDSLCDIVSFGAAPAAILYASIGATGGFRYFVIFVCLFMLFCGLLRLARYNVICNRIDYDGFVGFPIPGMAMVLVTYGLSGCFNNVVALILMLFAGYLMISTIRYPKPKDMSLLAIGAILILLIIIPIDLVVFGINIPALLLFILVFLYMLVPCLEFFFEIDGLLNKEVALEQVSKAKQVTEVKFSKSIDAAGSKFNSTKDKLNNMKNTVNKNYEDNDENLIEEQDEWL